MNNISKSKQPMLTLILVTLFWFAQYVYIPFQTPFLTSIGVTTSMIGIILGAYGLIQMLVRLPIGLCADAVGKHKIFIVIGVLSASLGSIIRIIFPTGTGFLVANIFSSLASSTWISYMVHYTNFFSKDDQASATSTIVAYNNLGMLLAFICATFTYDFFGMTFLCIASSASGIIGFLLALQLKEERPTHQRLPVKELLTICKNKRLIIFSLMTLVQQGVQMATATSFTNQILKDLGASSLVVGFSSIFFMASAVFSAKLVPTSIFKKIGPMRMIPISFLLLCCYCAFVPLVGSIPLIFIMQFIPGMCSGMLFSYLVSEAMMEVPASHKSTAMGAYQALYALGITALPMITGKIASSFELTTGYHFLAVIALISAIGAISFFALQRKKTT